MFDMLLSQLTGWPIGLSQPLQSPVKKTNIPEMKILRALQEWRMDARSNNLHFEVLWWDIAKRIASPSTASRQHLTQREWWELSVPLHSCQSFRQHKPLCVPSTYFHCHCTQLFVGESIGHIWLVLSALCLCLVTHSHWLSTHFHFCNVSARNSEWLIRYEQNKFSPKKCHTRFSTMFDEFQS